MGNCCSALAGSGSKNKNTAASKEAQHNAPKSEADKALPNTSGVDSPHTQNLEINEIELVAKQPVKETVKETPVEERVVAPIENKVEIVQQQDEERVVELAEIKEELEVKEEIVIKEPVEVAVEVEVKDVVVEEAANELVVDEPVKEPTKTESQDEEDQQTLSVELPTHLRKYIIGPKGQFIKDIQSQSDTTINTDESDPKFITIKANNSSDAEKAKELLMKKLHECGWVFDADKGEYVEHGESHQSYQKSRELADMHAQKRAECFEKSKQAFEAGDKKLAKELSEEGKRHGELMEQANKQAIKEILAHNDKGPNTIDMHGLRVAEALEALEEKIKEMEKPQVLTVITGAGNHSENNNAKIKPAVVEFLRKNNYEFEELNNGSYSVQLQ